MTVPLIVIFGAGLFCLLVVMLIPACVRATATRWDSQTGAQSQPAPETIIAAHSPVSAEEEGALEPQVSALPYHSPDLRLPQLPEPGFHSHFKVVSVLPFPTSVISPVESPRSGARFKGSCA